MRDGWDRRIARAVDLARCADGASSLLSFYVELLTLQKQIYDQLRARPQWIASGALDHDCPIVSAAGVPLIAAIADHGPQPLAVEARQLMAEGDAAVQQVLLEYWHSPSDRRFFAKAMLQPYAQWLAEQGIRPKGVGHPSDTHRTPIRHQCPFCGGAPQVSILETAAAADGASRRLLCATCLTPWPCRRVVCVWCGEEDERKLAYFHSAALDHLRVDACDTCRHYIKSIDRTRLGHAVPLVDEVAGAALDLWARDRGYQKIELNLVGL